MKKTLSCILASAILAAAFPAVSLAADPAALEQAIVTAKERIQIPAEYTEFESNIVSERGEEQFELSWSTKPNDYEEIKRIRITVNSHGDLTSYYSSQNRKDTDDVHFAQYSGAEMKDLAKNWLAEINPGWIAELPDESAEYPETGSVYSRVDSITFPRLVNGLPFCDNQVNISVNNHTGEIVNMYANWTYDTNYPAADSAISVQEAAKIFLEKSPMQLVYRQTGDKKQAIPVYQPKNSELELSGSTGEEFNRYVYRGMGNMSGGGSADSTAKNEATVEDSGLSESEISNLQEVSGLLSQDVLRNKVEGLKNTGVENARFMSCSYQNLVRYNDREEKESEYRAILSYSSFEAESGKETGYFRFTLDAKTGELLQYFSGSYGGNNQTGNKDNRLERQEAINKAEFFAEVAAPEEFAKTKLREEETDKDYAEDDFYLTFTRMENEIPFHNNGIYVDVDAYTGRIRSFSKDWDKEMTFDSPEGILPVDRAGQLFMEKIGLVLSYALEQKGDSPAVGLMYRLNDEIPPYLDAKTGDILNYSGEIFNPSAEETVLPEDLEGHYAKEPVLALIRAGVLTPEKGETTFRPDETITQKELLAFVSGLKMGRIPYLENTDEILATARRYGMISENIDPDSSASREDGAVFIIRALGYEKPAALTDIYRTNFSDEDLISPEKLGYVALARGFGIVSGDENNQFHPQDTLSRGDAAIMIYNYMAK